LAISDLLASKLTFDRKTHSFSPNPKFPPVNNKHQQHCIPPKSNMPPKAEGSSKAAVSNDAFLAACIKHANQKLSVNFETLAASIGMSTGGAA